MKNTNISIFSACLGSIAITLMRVIKKIKLLLIWGFKAIFFEISLIFSHK